MIVGYGNKTFNDKYKLFKTQEAFDKFVRNENTPSMLFRARDYIDFNKNQIETQDSAFRTIEHLTIETPVKSCEFAIDDIIYDLKGKKAWRINNIRVADDNRNKEHSLRPRAFTILELKR